MFRLIVVAAVVIAAGADPIMPKSNGLEIVGGRPIDITQAPYQVALESNRQFLCGGSILSTTRILTAAHCTDGEHPSTMVVRAGSATRLSGGQVSRVSRVYQHPGYSRNTVDYDVAVLILADPLRLGPGVQPIALQPAGQEIPDGTPGAVSGWGLLSDKGQSPVNLQMVQLPKFNHAQCENAYRARGYRVSPRMTCYGYQEGRRSACQGDSGGPLVANGKQVGIVSWGVECALPGHPTVFAKVSNSEINQYINNSV